MSIRVETIDFSHLTVQERLLLAQRLWDSVRPALDSEPISEEELAELDRRWSSLIADPSRASDWRDVQDRILARLAK